MGSSHESSPNGTRSEADLHRILDKTLKELDLSRLGKSQDGEEYPCTSGKVRDILDLGRELLILTTDRISAFDRVLTTIPCKGEVLNRVSAFWFEKTSSIVPNHLIETPSPRSMLVRKAQVLPIEVVVRGYLTGSAWRAYRDGQTVSGLRLPSGLKKDEKLSEPLITPSTKEERGQHDRPISREEILAGGIVEERLWAEVERAALALFGAGSELVAGRGLILVDTKYEFGLADGRLLLIDEVHTPDSSRYWFADSYEERLARGEDQRELDKEYLRRWLMKRGFSGDGAPPEIPDEVRVGVASRYIRAFELITGEHFSPSELDGEAEFRLLADRLS
jgi:phosphoribosylaminoimidazole-succinocarboxamide synthase